MRCSKSSVIESALDEIRSVRVSQLLTHHCHRRRRLFGGDAVHVALILQTRATARGARNALSRLLRRYHAADGSLDGLIHLAADAGANSPDAGASYRSPLAAQRLCISHQRHQPESEEK